GVAMPQAGWLAPRRRWDIAASRKNYGAMIGQRSGNYRAPSKQLRGAFPCFYFLPSAGGVTGEVLPGRPPRVPLGAPGPPTDDLKNWKNSELGSTTSKSPILEKAAR